MSTTITATVLFRSGVERVYSFSIPEADASFDELQALANDMRDLVKRVYKESDMTANVVLGTTVIRVEDTSAITFDVKVDSAD